MRFCERNGKKRLEESERGGGRNGSCNGFGAALFPVGYVQEEGSHERRI